MNRSDSLYRKSIRFVIPFLGGALSGFLVQLLIVNILILTIKMSSANKAGAWVIFFLMIGTLSLANGITWGVLYCRNYPHSIIPWRKMGQSYFRIVIILYIILIVIAAIISLFRFIAKNEIAGVIFGIILICSPVLALLYIPYRSFGNKNIYYTDRKEIDDSVHHYEKLLFYFGLRSVF